MSFWVLPVLCRVLASISVSPLTEEEAHKPEIIEQLKSLDASIKEKIGDQ